MEDYLSTTQTKDNSSKKILLKQHPWSNPLLQLAHLSNQLRNPVLSYQEASSDKDLKFPIPTSNLIQTNTSPRTTTSNEKALENQIHNLFSFSFQLSNKNLVKMQHFYTQMIAEATSLHELILYTKNPSGKKGKGERVRIRNSVPSILGLLKSAVNNKGSSFSIPDPLKKK